MEMQRRSLILGVVLLIGFALTNSEAALTVPPIHIDTPFNRSSFPPGFIFGSASGSYQHPCITYILTCSDQAWDTYTHNHSERIADRSNGDIALDQYHKYKEDVGIMKDMGLDAYRFSISWSRLLPSGKLSDGVNEDGITYTTI
ncbi:unnamed protein product [Prunus brigantina]